MKPKPPAEFSWARRTVGSVDDDSDVLERGDMSLLISAHRYELPPTVNSLVYSYVQMGNKMAIVTTCFAGIMVSIASSSISSPITSPWSYVLRGLLYASIISNSGAAALALVFINKASYLPSLARALFLTDQESWPYLVAAHGKLLPEKVLSHPSRDRHFDLMMHFGLNKYTLVVWKASWYGCYFGGGTLFVALGILMWLNENSVLATVLTILIMISAAWLLITCLLSEARRTGSWMDFRCRTGKG